MNSHLVASPPPNPKTLSKTEYFRREILETALKHFSLYGYEGASIRRIAQELNTTHSLIIYHFSSKDELWRATLEWAVGDYVQSTLNLLRESPDTAATTLRKFIERFVRLSAQRPEIHRILTMAGTQQDSRIDWLIETHLKEHFDFVVNLIRQGQQEGTVRVGDPVRLYYHIIGSAGTLFTLSEEFQLLTGKDVFSETEIYYTIAFIFDVVFEQNRRASP